MNYLMAMALILLGTIVSALSGSHNTYWLLVSDANVALGLFLAWWLEGKGKRGINVTINVKRAEE